MHAPPRIYNVFPRLVGSMESWVEHARRAERMGFDWFYVNPFQYPGFSGSIYAVKDYYRVDPLLLPEAHPDNHYDDEPRDDGGTELLRETLAGVRAAGLRPAADLVINHTARDAPLVEQHPEWYARGEDGSIESPSAIDPADARNVTVWGDLAELAHGEGDDADALSDYFVEVVRHYVRLGFVGFRCDAAYKVPAHVWQKLVAAAREVDPEAQFFGETLGARLEEIESLGQAGFHYIFNSSKWWDFSESWLMEQMRDHAGIAPSISFPESHDTPRLWSESGGSLVEQQRRYAFAAAFSSGVLMPIGYEYGFGHQLHVVDTRADDWEEPRADLADFLARVNAWKVEHAGLANDVVSVVSDGDGAGLLIEKDGAWLAVNRDLETACEVGLPEAAQGARVLRPFDGADGDAAGATLSLSAGEVAYVVGG